jgi:predicted acyl esterase
MHRTRRARAIATCSCALLAVAMLAAACSSDDSADDTADTTAAEDATTTTAGASSDGIDPDADRGGGRVDLDADAAAAAFDASTGVESVTVTGAEPGEQLTLVTSSGVRIVTGRTDEAGQWHVAYIPDEFLDIEGGMQEGLPTTQGRSLPPGTYRVVSEESDPVELSDELAVAGRDDVPDASFFEGKDLTADCPDMAETRACYTYIEMRDGVSLSAMIRWPDPALYGEPPYPTVVEYSGYGPSRPEGDGEPGTMIAGLLGYATVGVNMRGSGCSGGVFDTFNPAQQADGYDTIETIATQPWVLHGEPGMIGLSYSGITQLFTASTQPPHLAAITPLSVIEDPWLQQWPGGIYNQGFTKNWLEERDRQNAPDGDSWVATQLDGGDEQCEANVALRTQNPDFAAFGHSLVFRPPDADNRRLAILVQDIDVPVYLTGAWQDEQTGSKFATMLDRFTTDQAHFTVFNGHHPDGYTPLVLTRWYEFLEFYVARRTPDLLPIIEAGSPAVLEENFGIPVGLGPDRFEGQPYEEALAAYEAEPRVRVLFENGWGLPEYPGGAQATFEASFDTWPPRDAATRQWFLAPDGALAAEAPADERAERFRFDPESGAITYATEVDYNFQGPVPEFEWPASVEGDALVYLGEPLAEPTVLAGPGYATVWLNTEVDDATVEVTLSEVREDGTEIRIQGGWLRVGHSVLDPDLSDDLRIEPTYLESDFTPPVPGEWTEVTVPIYPFAHPMRAGSRLAVRIDTPGRDTPFWAFENPEYTAEEAGEDGEVWHTVGVGGAHASSLVIMDLSDIEIPQAVLDSPPPCPGLRGQICRPWAPPTNTPAD